MIFRFRHRVVTAAILLVAAAGAVAAAEGMTVGGFLVEIARVKQLPATTPADAARALRTAGFEVPSDKLDATLTEGRVSQIANALGIRVSTRSPESPFTRQQVDSFLTAFGSELRSPDPSGNSAPPPDERPGANPLEKGKGKKKGLRTPSDPI